MTPMFEQPALGLLMSALEGYGQRWRAPRPVRIPCRTLICSLAEEGGRSLTRTESQLLSQAVRWYIARNLAAKEILGEWIVPAGPTPEIPAVDLWA